MCPASAIVVRRPSRKLATRALESRTVLAQPARHERIAGSDPQHRRRDRAATPRAPPRSGRRSETAACGADRSAGARCRRAAPPPSVRRETPPCRAAGADCSSAADRRRRRDSHTAQTTADRAARRATSASLSGASSRRLGGNAEAFERHQRARRAAAARRRRCSATLPPRLWPTRRAGVIRREMLEQRVEVGDVVGEPVAVGAPRASAEAAPVGRDHVPVARQRVDQKLERCADVHPAVQHEKLRRRGIAPAFARGTTARAPRRTATSKASWPHRPRRSLRSSLRRHFFLHRKFPSCQPVRYWPSLLKRAAILVLDAADARAAVGVALPIRQRKALQIDVGGRIRIRRRRRLRLGRRRRFRARVRVGGGSRLSGDDNGGGTDAQAARTSAVANATARRRGRGAPVSARWRSSGSAAEASKIVPHERVRGRPAVRPPAPAQRVLDRRRHGAHRRRGRRGRGGRACRRSRSPISPTCSAWSSSTRRRARAASSRSSAATSGSRTRPSATRRIALLLLCQSRAGYLRLADWLTRAYRTNQHRGRAELRREWFAEGTDGLIALSGCARRRRRPGAGCRATRRRPANAARAWAGAVSRPLLPRSAARRPRRRRRAGRGDACGSPRELGAAGRRDASGAVPATATTSARTRRACASPRATCSPTRAGRGASRPSSISRRRPRWRQLFADLPEALANSVAIAQRCNLTIPLGKNYLPAFPDARPASRSTSICATRRRRGSSGGSPRCIPMPASATRKRPEYVARLEFETEDHHPDGLRRLLPDRRRLHQLGASATACRSGPGAARAPARSSPTALGITDLDPLRYDAAVRALPQSRARVDARLRHRLLPGRPRPRHRLRASRSTAPNRCRRSRPSARWRRRRWCATSAACSTCRTASATASPS